MLQVLYVSKDSSQEICSLSKRRLHDFKETISLMCFPLHSPQLSVWSNDMKTFFPAVILMYFYLSISHFESHQHCQLLFPEAHYVCATLWQEV